MSIKRKLKQLFKMLLLFGCRQNSMAEYVLKQDCTFLFYSFELLIQTLHLNHWVSEVNTVRGQKRFSLVD